MSLKLKLSVFISLIIFVILASAAFLNILVRSSEIEQELILRDKITSEKMVPELVNDMDNYYAFSFDTFTQLVNDTIGQDKDILHIRIININGNVLFDSQEIHSGKYVNGASRAIMDKNFLDKIYAQKVSQDFFQYNNQKVIRVTTPYINSNGVYRAVVEFYFSTAPINNSVNQAIIYFFTLFVIFLVLGVISTLIFANQITKPILKLTQGVKKLDSGESDVLVVIKSKDEIGDLAQSFNQMATKLKEYQEGLEQRIQEKTEELSKQLLASEGQNKTLADNKIAMLNLLEDAKSLEEQLKQEKESVEKKVIERTNELSEEKIKLSASISSLTLGFIMTDKENNIVTINQAARNILCASSSSPLVTVVKCTLTHIEDELKGAIDLRALINQSISEKKILLIKELAFANRFLKIFITPIMEGTEAIGSVVLVDDITEAKIVERSKDEFFSIASHELRTPLTAIRGNTSLIQQYYADKLEDKDLKEMVDDINTSSIRLISIVNDFLDMSRLELGKMVFKKESIGLVELAQSVIKEYQTTGSLKMLSLSFIPPNEALPNVMGDNVRARQVLVNLIGNGVKYTEKGGITVSVVRNDKSIEVLVSDTGKGISSENQNLLFRKFQQAGDSIYTRDSSQSTGLGLYISKLMMEGMGGKVGLKSSVEGKGSVFFFSLPIEQ